jgi:energy-converting hydrogenase Eha subunit B
MTVPFSPGQQGDDEEISDSLEARQELQSGEQVTEEEHVSAEKLLPPEAQGETNGGPLGCCLGVTVGLLLSLMVAILSRLYADPLAQVFHGNLSITVRIVMFIFAIAGAVLFGYFGWKIGKHLYREYELSPRQQQRLAHLEQRHIQRQARRH